MEGPGYRDEIEQLLKNIYSQYDTANTGKLEGESQQKFMREFKVGPEESATLEGFKKKYYREMEWFFSVFDNVNLNELELVNKRLTVGVNNDDTASTKSYLHLDYFFSAESRLNHLKESFPSLSLNPDNTFLLLRVQTSNPSGVKETVEGLFEMGKQMVAPMLDLDGDLLKLESTVEADTVTFKLSAAVPFLNMFMETAGILGRRVQKVVADFSFKVDLSRSFDDLVVNKDEDALRTVVRGGKLSVNLTTNSFTTIVDVLQTLGFVKHKRLMVASFLSLLDVDAKLNLKMSNLENNVFWKNLPKFNLFSPENMTVMTGVSYLTEFQNSMPFLQTLQELSGHHELVLNTHVGLVRVQLGSTGFNSLLEELKKTFSG